MQLCISTPLFFVRDVLWTPLTSRGRQRFMWRLRGAQWKCAGRCCRELGAGCSMRRTTAGSHHWSSANRGKRSGESAVFRKLCEEKSLTTIIPLCVHTSRLLFFSLGILMQINLLLYYVIFFSRHQQLTKLLSRYINEPLYLKPQESNGK